MLCLGSSMRAFPDVQIAVGEILPPVSGAD